ncbi:MAG TPA: F0F1 ATP synthase subunit delta [Patescibacteria group bacterium]|nr:F0F1 ATP synthase subunit delta [Patescibacteria group bacterium]
MVGTLLPFIIVITIAFAVVLFVLKKMLWSDTESAVNRLQTSYEEIKKQKIELDQKLLQAETEYKNKKEEAEKIAHDLVEKANLDAAAVREDAFKKAKTESDAIIDKAHKTVEKIKTDIARAMELRIVEISGGLIKDVLSDAALEQVHKIMADDFLKELAEVDMAMISADVKDVEVVSFRPLTDLQRKRIKEIVSQKVKRDFVLVEKTDHALLSGILLKFGSLALDGALASKIRDGVITEKQRLDE